MRVDPVVRLDPAKLQLAVGGGHHSLDADLLFAVLAILAVQAAVESVANSDMISNLEIIDSLANLGDNADRFVPGYIRVGGGAPLVVRHADIGMAEATELHLDLDVLVGGRAPADRDLAELGVLGHFANSLGLVVFHSLIVLLNSRDSHRMKPILTLKLQTRRYTDTPSIKPADR